MSDLSRPKPAVESRAFLTDYFDRVQAMVEVSRTMTPALDQVKGLFVGAASAGGRVLLVGNGGSAAIASHIAVDLAKNAKTPAMAFNDTALVTCLANDYGHDHWMARALAIYAQPGDVVVAISSSGRSANVVNASHAAVERGLEVVTLSGFAADNPLRQTGTVNLWADSRAYNIVETIHQLWLMSVVDMIIGTAEYAAS